MRRRQFLASGSALLSVGLAGCGHPPVVLYMDEASDEDVAAAVSTTADPDSETHAIVVEAAENGTATRRGRSDLFDRVGTVRVDGTFYEVTETRLASSEVTVYEVLIDFDPAETTPELGAIAFDDLPETDRERLGPILTEDDHPRGERYDVGVAYGSAAEVGNDSVFVPRREYDVLVHDGNRYRIAVNSRTAPEATYRYEVTEVAPSLEAFADRVRRRYLFVLTGLTEAERAVVEEAIDEGYFEEDEAFRSVVDRIRQHEALTVDDFYGTWLLEYDGLEYLTYAEW